MCLYVGLDKSDRDLKLPKHNIWYFKEKNYDQIFQSKSLEEFYYKLLSILELEIADEHINKSIN